MFSSTGQHPKHSIQDVQFMKITMAKQLLRTPCTTPMRSQWKGRQYDSILTWTQSAQWYNTANFCLLQKLGKLTHKTVHVSSLLNKLKHTFQDLLSHPFLRNDREECFFHKLDHNASSCLPWRVLQKFSCTPRVLTHSLFAFLKKEIILKHKLICIYWRSIHYQYFCAL